MSDSREGAGPPRNSPSFSLPEMLSERCVHSLIGNASCRACIDACPRQAWVLGDEALGLAIDLCDGCGLCAPDCPQQAISVQKFPLLKLWNKSGAAFVACEISGVSGRSGILPCVHSIGYRDILDIYRLGIRNFALSTGNCRACARGNGVYLPKRIETLNRALAATESPPIHVNSLTSEEWSRLSQALAEIESGPRLSRRGFFRSLATADEGADSKISELLGRQHTGFKPVGELLPDQSPSALWPSVPSIYGTVCTGCDACVKLCPHSAILLSKSEDQICYRIEPEHCTGCGICTDVCEHDAILLESWAMQQQPAIPLMELTCIVCGVLFKLPEARADSLKNRCPVCSKKNRQKLFQVIE